MKKILIAGVVASISLLGGCKENKTNLQKTFINTTTDKCTNYLRESLKSPSSLRINDIKVFLTEPKVQSVYRVFGENLIKDGKIQEAHTQNKKRFRELHTTINYEAQNSFGVYLRGVYECQYLFKLEGEGAPKPLDVYLINLGGNDQDLGVDVSIPIVDFTESNWKLNKLISNISTPTNTAFNEFDKEIFNGLLKHHIVIEREKEAIKIRSSWNDMGAEQAARDAMDAAAEASAIAAQVAANY